MTDYSTMIEALRDEAALGKVGDGHRMISAEALNAVAYALEELSAENKNECKEWKERGDALGKALNVAFSDFAKFEKNQSWISVTERLPEESEGLNWHEDMMIRFTSVWCCDAKTGTIEVRNRFQGKMTGNEYLDKYTKDTDWHWSKSWWEPTHWMPIVPLPEPPKEEEGE